MNRNKEDRWVEKESKEKGMKWVNRGDEMRRILDKYWRRLNSNARGEERRRKERRGEDREGQGRRGQRRIG